MNHFFGIRYFLVFGIRVGDKSYVARLFFIIYKNN